jgi:hypothetical protein
MKRKNKLKREAISSARSTWRVVKSMCSFHSVKTTLDHAECLVIPRDIRRESGIKPAMPLEVRYW